MSSASTAGAWAVGLATIHEASGRVLDTRFPDPALGVADAARALGPQGGTAVLDAEAAAALGAGELARAAGGDELRGVRVACVLTVLDDLGAAPADAHDAYLRLHLISHRLVLPHGLSLDGVFGILSNVVWTDAGPCDPEGFEEVRVRFLAAGRRLQVTSVDKFPRMTDYVIPSGVRIADASRVRLGAHLASGTTVMHEGFVNFNAGTLGTSMVEGRISQGVVVDEKYRAAQYHFFEFTTGGRFGALFQLGDKQPQQVLERHRRAQNAGVVLDQLGAQQALERTHQTAFVAFQVLMQRQTTVHRAAFFNIEEHH